jgi:hypothetical protein
MTIGGEGKIRLGKRVKLLIVEFIINIEEQEYSRI